VGDAQGLIGGVFTLDEREGALVGADQAADGFANGEGNVAGEVEDAAHQKLPDA